MQPTYVPSLVTPEPLGCSHAELMARYARHARAAALTNGPLKAWHILLAKGLYRMLADIECDGGPAAPMGMPHVLTITDTEACQLAVRA